MTVFVVSIINAWFAFLGKMSLGHSGDNLVNLLLFPSADCFLLEESSFTCSTKIKGGDEKRGYLTSSAPEMT